MVISHIHIDSYHNNQTYQFNNLSRNTLNGSPCSGLVNVSAIISFVFIYIKETSPEMYLFIPRQIKNLDFAMFLWQIFVFFRVNVKKYDTTKNDC